MPNTPTNPEILAQIDALPMTNKRFLELAGVYPTFLSIARKGGVAGQKCQPMWQKIKDALRGAQKTPAEKIAAEVRGVEPEASRKASQRPQDASVDGSSLSTQIDAARTVEDLEEVTRTTAMGVADGTISENVGRTLAPLISRQQQLLELRLEQEAIAKAGEEVIVKVVLVRGWTGGPLPA